MNCQECQNKIKQYVETIENNNGKINELTNAMEVLTNTANNEIQEFTKTLSREFNNKTIIVDEEKNNSEEEEEEEENSLMSNLKEFEKAIENIEDVQLDINKIKDIQELNEINSNLEEMTKKLTKENLVKQRRRKVVF